MRTIFHCVSSARKTAGKWRFLVKNLLGRESFLINRLIISSINMTGIQVDYSYIKSSTNIMSVMECMSIVELKKGQKNIIFIKVDN